MRYSLLICLLVNAIQQCFLICTDELRGQLMDPRWRLVDPGYSCGRSTTLSSRIMGGISATPGEYPWIVHLVYTAHKVPPRALCGGSLISDRYILTAAHCCLIANYTMKEVRLGEYASRQVEVGTESHSMTVAVEGVQPHAGYDPTFTINDICLVRLTHPVQFNDFVRPICLPRFCSLANLDLTGLWMEVAGWGDLETDPAKLPSNVLQKLVVPVVSSERCREIWNDTETMEGSLQICAGGHKGRDTCGGDSGGPLMLQALTGDDPRMFLMGIVSYGERCARWRKHLAPGVYTRVTGYLTWIIENIRE